MEYQSIMEEPPGGVNHGRSARVLDESVTSRFRSLEAQTESFAANGGWSAARGVAHRGVVHPSEYVDPESLREKAERLFGFTVAEVGAAFAAGRPTSDRASLRSKVDARMLEVSEAGGNMVALGRALGLTIEDAGNGARCQPIERSIARARGAA